MIDSESGPFTMKSTAPRDSDSESDSDESDDCDSDESDEPEHVMWISSPISGVYYIYIYME